MHQQRDAELRQRQQKAADQAVMLDARLRAPILLIHTSSGKALSPITCAGTMK
ncbi:MAG: hypothetical protein RQ715_01820 [Methylococcales bacterium]|nr:hypothetical protein [Methylococcales bacterium]